MPESWNPRFLAMANSVVRDIPRIRAILHQLGIRSVDYEDPEDYVPSAFTNAFGLDKVVPFQAALAKAGLLIDDGPVDIQQELFDRLVTLQAIGSRAYLPANPRVAARRLLLASDLVCQVEADGQQGTGLLVAPTLVATAAHVVAPLVDEVQPGSFSARTGSTSRIHVTFGNVADLLDDQESPTQLTGTPTPLAAAWLEYYSPPATQETAADFVVDSVVGIGEDGPWDAALLRLAEERPFHPRPPCESIPRSRFQIHVLHHPDNGTGQALPMLWSIGTVDRPLGDPPMRLLHSANTSAGSLGGPVFDAEFQVVGLHQAGRPGRLASGEDEVCNRAVPMRPLVSKIESLKVPESVPLVPTVEKADEQGNAVTRTVIGRLGTVERIHRGLHPDATAPERLIVVVGEPGHGLRFTKYLVRALVTRFSGVYAAIDVANCQREDAASFAEKVAGAFAAETGAGPLTGLTTGQREVRSRTVVALSETLKEIAKPDGAWLVLEGFDTAAERLSASVMDLVGQLIAELPQAPGVHLVLAGWPENLPTGFETSIDYLVAPSAEDIARTLLPPAPTPALLSFVVPTVEMALKAAELAIPGACAYRIAERARSAVAHGAPKEQHAFRGGTCRALRGSKVHSHRSSGEEGGQAQGASRRCSSPTTPTPTTTAVPMAGRW